MTLHTELPRFTRPHIRQVRVKVCGITQPQHALVAAASGADMVGVVFATSKRNVSVAQAKTISNALERAERKPLLVGVFVNEELERICEIAGAVGLEVVQMSGDESPEEVEACARRYPVIKALRFPMGTSLGQACELADRYLGCGPKGRVKLLIDAYRPGEYGGTGHAADWALAGELASRHEIILAGGLNAGNLAYALAAVQPWGVDVSSGVETGGVKDPELIRAFVGTARLGLQVGI